MSHVAYVDGQYLPHRVTAVHTEDRGDQFGDAAPIDDGRPGPLTQRLRELYLAHVPETA